MLDSPAVGDETITGSPGVVLSGSELPGLTTGRSEDVNSPVAKRRQAI